MQNAEWYVNWFDSPYYHLLYNNRDFNEADLFMRQLCAHLGLDKKTKIWDLACGKGRHAIALNQMGFDVTGTDLSKNSIEAATVFSNNTLHFEVQDMREHFRTDYFDAVFNLFTSIGYFQNYADNARVFLSVSQALQAGGFFAVDFFNADKVCRNMKETACERRDELVFEISKKIEDNHIIKRIQFEDNGHSYYFEESVTLLRQHDFEQFGRAAGLILHETFGNYHLEPFDAHNSDRLILIFKK